MTPALEIQRIAPDRTRLWLPARRGDRAYLMAIARRFRAMPGMSGTEVDAAAGRILLRHGADVDLRGLRPAFWQVDEEPGAADRAGLVREEARLDFPDLADLAIEAARSAIERRPSPILLEWTVTRIIPALVRSALARG